jgi:hypothetical protein
MQTDTNTFHTTDHKAVLNAIHTAMSGVEWSPDTLDEIASILTDAGYVIDAPIEQS